ncbi:MAG: beta-lactamase family protein [Chloroflexi bacterium]|nr:beta-lactamase family protein [Chloroflexota bacterium]
MSGSIAAVEELLAGRFESLGSPGLAAGIVQGDDLIWSGGFGVSDLETGRAPNSRTIARVASITKTFTGTAILQLRDEAKLALDDPLTTHIPEFAQVQERGGRVEDVTLRRMLTHYSGLSAETAGLSWAADEFPTLEQILNALSETEVVIPADSQWKYSNLAFGLLGEVIKRASGTDYVEYMHANVIDPVGLKSTVFDLTDDLRPDFYTGYDSVIPGDESRDEVRVAAYRHLNGVMSCGQLHSNVEDLAKWISFQFREDGGERKGAQVLRGRSLNEMHRPQYAEPDWSTGQCLSWRAFRIEDRVYHSHGGGIHGFGSLMAFNIPTKTGVIILANAWPLVGVEPIARDAIETFLTGKPGPKQIIKQIEVPEASPVPEELSDYTGYYIAEPGIPANVDYRDDHLWMTAPGNGGYSIHAPAQFDSSGTDGTFIMRGHRGSGEKAVFTDSGHDGSAGFTLGGWWYRKVR